jgi:hypothetical protein
VRDVKKTWWLFAAALAAGCTGGTGSCPSDLPPSCPPGAAGYQATVAPILAAKCVSCHEPGGQSLHFLQTYQEVSLLHGQVLDQVYSCRMPPAGYTPLTETERTELLGWLVCGAPND